jgi:hypothetical protein
MLDGGAQQGGNGEGDGIQRKGEDRAAGGDQQAGRDRVEFPRFAGQG